ARATLRLDDDAAGIHLSLPVSCAEACTFFGHVPPGSYRASVGAPFALPGHRALLAEALSLRAPSTDLRLSAAAPITISGTLDESRVGCPAWMPIVSFRRVADGEEFGGAVV